ncbi:MAG: transcriptional repressor [Tannerella sp.]|jgi:Fe2+ or Zn2+ uptake regulation protein|nr:transcriptional repressor [Tannerella sp.]
MDKRKRNTKTKGLVMRVFENSEHALCYDDIEKQLTGQLDRVTIYRILQGFCEDGKIHRIVGDNGKTYYACCHDCDHEHHHDDHPHFRCIKCNTVICIEENLSAQKVPEEYSISSVSTFISGVCPKCRPVKFVSE